jgi:hypothetical protein
VSCPWPRPAPALPAAPGRIRTRDRTAPRTRTRSAPRTVTAPRTAPVPGARTRARPVTNEAAEVHFAADLAEGRVPSARRIKTELRTGQDRAARIRDHLAALAAAPTRQPDPAPTRRTA